MKVINYVYLLLIAICLFSCVTEDENTTSQKVGDFKSLTAKSALDNANINTNGKGIFETYYAKGNFLTYTAPSNDIIIYTITDNVKHFFTIVPKTKLNNKAFSSIHSIASVWGALVINDNEVYGIEDNLNFHGKNAIDKITKKETPNIIETISVSHLNVLPDAESYNKINIENLQDLIDFYNQSQQQRFVHNGDCDHGGEGATGCSSSGSNSCSVSCSSGYYACCVEGGTVDNCHCHKVGIK